MKKNLFLLLSVFVLTSCEETSEEIGWFQEVYEVKSRDWIFVQNPGGDEGSYNYFEFPERAITNYVYNNGVIIVYLIQNPGGANETQTPIAFGRPKLNDSNQSWIDFISYDYKPGSIAFYYESDDFSPDAPPTCTFRVVMMWK